jgi:hypothetical protein
VAEIKITGVNGAAPSTDSSNPTPCTTMLSVNGTYSAKEGSLTVKCFLTYPGQPGKNTSAQTSPAGGIWTVAFGGVGVTAPDSYTQLDAKLYSGTTELDKDGPYYLKIS